VTELLRIYSLKHWREKMTKTRQALPALANVCREEDVCFSEAMAEEYYKRYEGLVFPPTKILMRSREVTISFLFDVSLPHLPCSGRELNVFVVLLQFNSQTHLQR
jgi:hypothetical protein